MKIRPHVIFFIVDQLSAGWPEAADSGVCDVPDRCAKW